MTFTMKTSASTRGAIIALHGAGLSNGEIANRLDISKHTVARWIQRYNETGEVLHKRGAGRPRCTSPMEDRAIADIISNSPFTPATVIRQQLRLPCTPQTIRNRHISSGLHGRIPARKPLLSETNMERRMEYALEYADKPAAFWDDVIYCDETTFSTDETVTARVWRPKNERYVSLSLSLSLL